MIREFDITKTCLWVCLFEAEIINPFKIFQNSIFIGKICRISREATPYTELTSFFMIQRHKDVTFFPNKPNKSVFFSKKIKKYLYN